MFNWQTLIASHGGDPSSVIDAILEGRIKDKSSSAGQKDDVKKNNLPTATTEPESLLTARSNIYDHDEFDVFHHGNVDLSRVHIVKKLVLCTCHLWLCLTSSVIVNIVSSVIVEHFLYQVYGILE